jgi:LDH2 family malate/lactate/ureidoglycolate dehydrogenase
MTDVSPDETRPRFPAFLLAERSQVVLEERGLKPGSAAAAVRAMSHASRLGIDSHGFRLTPVYVRMIAAGQVNPAPHVKVTKQSASTGLIDADHGLGHDATYQAVDLACALAQASGIGAVGVFGSSHNGAAGAYAVAGAERGCVTLSSTNSDAAVALFNGGAAFHGTNPIAAAAPVPGSNPWLLDMATSSIPFNRVHLFASLGIALPPDVAADASGAVTTKAADVAMLSPLGGSGFGFKGAGLAGLVTVLCAALTGATLDPEMAKMSGPVVEGHRNCGHMIIAIAPSFFIGADAFGTAMTRYLAELRASPAKAGGEVLAPGDREWREARERDSAGIPVDRQTAEFLGLVG